MQLFIEPIDVWLFRDGKPFDARSDHRAQSIFPPYPSVMQGVIRSQQLVVQGIDLGNDSAENRAKIEALVGTTNDYGALRLRGPLLAKWDHENLTRYFPVPADVAPQGNGYRAQEPKPRSKLAGITTSLTNELSQMLFPKKDTTDTENDVSTKKELGAWMNEDELRKCLRGDQATAIETKDLFERENRFGIGRNDMTRTTEREYLYEAEFIRPCENVGLYVEVNGYDGWPPNGVMRIGGEGRGARYEIITAPKLPEPKKEVRGQFKIYFATPTYFKNGWVPASWSNFFDGDVQLVAAALNRYESIGGYDWANNSQKPARRYVPAGSVYYFQVNGNGTAQLKTNAITDFGAEIGFGQIFIEGE